MATFLLVHSPLVGPLTWSFVAEQLARAGHMAVVPLITNDANDPSPYVEQHIDTIARSLDRRYAEDQLFLVGHSGAGVLLPAAGQIVGKVAGYVFVDAAIPCDGASRLDLFPPREAERFRRAATNDIIPAWSEDSLTKLIPDPQVRSAFTDDLRPTPLAVYEEVIPVPSEWPDAPCSYLSFSGSSAYADDISHAKANNWPHEELPGYHFHMLVDPAEVAASLQRLAQRMIISGLMVKGAT